MQEIKESDRNLEPQTSLPGAENASDDPFAIDFFSPKADNVVIVETAETIETVVVHSELQTPTFWHASLPKISALVAELSNKLTRLPAGISEKIIEHASQTISELVLNNSAEAELFAAASEETDLDAEIAVLNSGQSVFLSFAVEPERASAVLALDSEVAISIIEKAFGEEKGNAVERRELSKTELAVIEFFALSILSRINQATGEPLFRLLAVEQSAPNWLAQQTPNAFAPDSAAVDAVVETPATRGLSVKIKLQIGEISGIANLLLPLPFLDNLNAGRNVLLSSRNKKRSEFKNLVSGVSLHLLIGETELAAAELAVLEKGDVVLIEKPAVNIAKNLTVKGLAECRIGDESSASIFGELEKNSSAADALRLKIGEILQRRQSLEPKRINMDEQLSEQSEEAGAVALEKITVTLKVELASRRVNLDELANMRAGQIIDLGTRATDPVELVSDGKAIALGELVDIEGSLGVRVTRVLV